MTPQLFGAKADGYTDDSEAIQKALDSSNKVFFPAGTYITKKSLVVRSNTEIWGEGENSVIQNNIEYGWGRNVLVCGAIDSGTLPASPNLLSAHQAYTITNSRYLYNVSNIKDFKTGDLLLITKGAIRTKNPQHSFVAKIKDIQRDKGCIVLDRKIGNKFINENVDIRNLSSFPDVLSELGIKAYVAENVKVHDINIKQGKDKGSGMYVIFASCYNSHFYNLWIKGNTCIGANLAAFSKFDNITGMFDGSFCDMPEYFISSEIKNVNATRYGHRVNRNGLSIFHGYGGVIRNCNIDFQNEGKIGFAEQEMPVISNNTFTNLSSGAGCLESSVWGDAKITNNYITCNDSSYVLTLFGDENSIQDNIIYSNKENWIKRIKTNNNKIRNNALYNK